MGSMRTLFACVTCRRSAATVHGRTIHPNPVCSRPRLARVDRWAGDRPLFIPVLRANPDTVAYWYPDVGEQLWEWWEARTRPVTVRPDDWDA